MDAIFGFCSDGSKQWQGWGTALKPSDISNAIDKAAGVERDAVPLVRCDGRLQHNKEGGGCGKKECECFIR